MKTYNNIEEVKADIKDGVLRVDDDIEINFDGFQIEADIVCKNIYSKDYRRNITAKNINARDINAGDINAWDITADNITAGDINARDISYFAFLNCYQSIKCSNIKGKRRPHNPLVCLDGKLKIRNTIDVIVEGKTVAISRESARALGLI